MGAVFRLSMRQMASRWRLTLIVLLAALPALIVAWAAWNGDGGVDADLVEVLIEQLIVGVVLPIVTLALATTAFGNEIEDRTLGLLATKPLAHWRIALPKLLASVALAAPPLIAGALVAMLIAFEGDVRPALSVCASILCGVFAYSAIFTWAGAITSRALGFALVYVFLWEGLLAGFLEGIRYLSVGAHTRAIAYALDKDALEMLGDRAIEFEAALVGAALVTAAFFLLTALRLRRMEIP